jgi:predicted N-formylglutamate amidohydrolase
MRRGLPHLQIEVRQDLVADEAGALRWADMLFDVIAEVLATPAASTIEHHWPLAGEG